MRSWCSLGDGSLTSSGHPMNPQDRFGHDPAPTVRGQVGRGNIRVHSRTDRRYWYLTCEQTFSATEGMPCYRLKKGADLVTMVLTLQCHGSPFKAIAAAFGLDERAIASWQAPAGAHCQQVHEHLEECGQVDLGHVQADESWVKVVGGKVWLVLALAATPRPWLGGVISAPRDEGLITALVWMVRACARHLGIMICVDVLTRVFWVAVRPSRRGARAWRWPRASCSSRSSNALQSAA